MINTNITIIYNTITMDSFFYLNKKRRENFKNITDKKPIHEWIDKLFDEVFIAYNCKKIDINFIGVNSDYTLIKYAIKSFNKNTNDLYLNLIESGCNIINRTYNTNDLYLNSIGPDCNKINIFNTISNSFKKDELNLHDLIEIVSIEIKLESILNKISSNFEVMVLSTTSAGKSTLINAMLGRELIPYKTPTILKVYDHDDMGHFVARRVVDGGITTQWEDANWGLLDEWNAKEDTSIIEIKGNIPSIDERAGIRMVLVDTPGPNNSRDTSHREATIRAIRSSQPSMVLYVLNSTQLSTDDDKALLGLIKDVMAEGGREAQDRFIFIANKIDNFDPEKGESVTHELKSVRSYLKENGIENPLVIPVSAELTKLLRIKKSGGKLTRSQRGNLSIYEELFLEEPEMNMLEQAKGDLSSGLYQELNSQLKDAVANGDYVAQAELLSGLPIVEYMITEHLNKHLNKITEEISLLLKIESEKSSTIKQLYIRHITSELNRIFNVL
ncbi:dynamin family protein [Photobacterium carnosum]|uniref:dynamin family protein n=1 Tax=Photobacterium carnosum TaxID=2023717 RepID=UPI00128BBDDA|nr:dynamin family protein [Photobacterium carnosum]KAE8175609.1 hypothetical protein CIT27_17605 [Photobacterium carnosum]